jgi:succinoglycan biosynthesis protein ExoA
MSTQNAEFAEDDIHAAPGVAPGEIVVAIPVLNEAGHIAGCIDSLMRGDARLALTQFVVADGGSTDGTREILDRLAEKLDNLTWIDNPGRLQSAGVNRVAEAFGSGRTFLVRCDAHSIYPPGYVTRVADELSARNVASLVVAMDAVGETCFQKANAWVVDTPFGSGGSAHRGGRRSQYVDHGHHAGFRLDVFNALGGYDAGFSHNEDAEYDARVVAAGGRLYMNADIRLSYKPRASLQALARQYFNYGKGRARTVNKHAMAMKPRQLFPVGNLLAVMACLILAPVWPWMLVYPLAYIGALCAVSAWLAFRHRSVCGLFCGLAAGIMHMSWGAGFLVQQWRDLRAR